MQTTALRALLVLLLSFLAVASLSSKKTIYISPAGDDKTGDGSQAKPYKSLQFALDQTPDVINLFPGSYPGFNQGTFNIETPLRIVGNVNDPRRTSITAPGGMVVLADLTLEGISFEKFSLQVQDGTFVMNKCIVTGAEVGLAVFASVGSVVVNNSIFYNNDMMNVGVSYSSSVTIQNSQLMKSEIGVACTPDSSVTLKDVIIRDNGAGVYMDESCRMSMTNASIWTNEKAGIYVKDSEATLVNSKVIGNEGVNGSGIYVTGDSTVKIDQVEFHQNVASGFGGAFYCGDRSSVTITNSQITQNSADVAGSGECVEGCKLSVDSATVILNNESKSGIQSHCKPQQQQQRRARKTLVMMN